MIFITHIKNKESNRRHHRITVRLNDFEYDLISSKAESIHLPIAVYLRQQAVNQNLIVHNHLVFDSEELKRLVGEYRKIGSNLNQIAKYFNSGGVASLEMRDMNQECIAKLFELGRDVLKLGGDFSGSVKTHRKQKRKL